MKLDPIDKDTRTRITAYVLLFAYNFIAVGEDNSYVMGALPVMLGADEEAQTVVLVMRLTDGTYARAIFSYHEDESGNLGVLNLDQQTVELGSL